MKYLLSIMAIFSLFSPMALANCEGFFPENDLYIPVDEKSLQGIGEAQFHSVIDKIEAVYTPIVASLGGELQIARLWENGTVNASAQQEGKIWKVNMFGGLARHKKITADGFALVLCHEIGHHIGGAPVYTGRTWASVEGQADYFATLKCLRRIWESDNNEAMITALEAPRYLINSCAKSWASSQERALCVRTSMAGDSVGKLFASSSWSRAPSFDRPSDEVVKVTAQGHPKPQCRLDTFFQGSLCEVPFKIDLSSADEVTGTCHRSLGHNFGLRPQCWFKPLTE